MNIWIAPFAVNSVSVLPPNDVVIFAQDKSSNIWADHFVRAQPQFRRRIQMPTSASPALALAIIQQAVTLAGRGGMLIFLVGHGASDYKPVEPDPKVGKVELSEGGTATLGGYQVQNTFVDVFYDANLAGPPSMSSLDHDKTFNPNAPGAKQRLASWDIYKRMGAAVRSQAIRKVLFLTCRVGGAQVFVQKIAHDWGTVVEAPIPRLVLALQQNGKMRLVLEGDPENFGTNTAASEENVPLFTSQNSYRAGPHLP